MKWPVAGCGDETRGMGTEEPPAQDRRYRPMGCRVHPAAPAADWCGWRPTPPDGPPVGGNHLLDGEAVVADTAEAATCAT